MRRIKTYVMTVGVALSVAPIFNYALAQQGNSATQLLLQVQDMKQEVGELRDLIERQQFQLKRLQQQADTQSKQLQLVQSARSVVSTNGALENNVDLSTYSNALPQSIPQSDLQPPLQFEPQTTVALTQQSDQGYVSANSSQDVSRAAQVAQQETSNVAEPQSQDDFYLPNRSPQGIPQNAASAANENAYTGAVASKPIEQPSSSVGSVNSVYPPIVDRSFSTSTPVVPVTGAGSQQVAGQNSAITNQAQAVNNQAQAVIQNQAVAAQVADPQVALATQYAASTIGQNQAQQTSSAPQFSSSTAALSAPKQVVSVPTQIVSVPTQVASLPPVTVAVQAQNSIDASQMSSQVTAAAPTSLPAGLNQPQVQTVLSEEDFYAQGFELLKQSKYEEAASVFERQLQAHPRGDLADDAHYWIAEAMHVSRKLDVAKVHLKAIISDYPQSRRLPDAMLKTAYIEQSQGNQIEARILFQEIVNQHPQSDAAIAAKNQLAAVN